MFKKDVKYVDYNGTERKETLYFNLTEAEIAEMQLSTTGGLDEMIRNMVEAQDGPALIKMFKELLLKSYGVKSADGRRFIKNDELRDEFMQTEAFSDLFMELAFNAEAGSEFVMGILPEKISKQMPKQSLPTATTNN